jgi:hypothetical protein
MNCKRCGKLTTCWTMSMFNTDEVCMECVLVEKNDPRYKAAVEAEASAVRRGDWNFRGIGWGRNR